MVALCIEIVYWVVARVVLTILYMKNFAAGRPWHKNLLIMLGHAAATIFPSEMLLFFGYHKKHSNDFEKALLNLSWLRRIISVVRVAILIIIQIAASQVKLADDFISMVYLF